MAQDIHDAWPAGPLQPALAPGEVHVWRSPLQPDPHRRRRLSPLLADVEKDRADRFRFDRDAHRYAIARALLRELLGRYCDTPPGRIALGETEHGRPFLTAGTAPEGFDFNLSHSGDLVLYAFGSTRLGVDVERITPLRDMADLVSINFSPRERETWFALPLEDRERGFFECWTRKEAFVKAIGEGLSHPLEAFDVTLAPGDEPRIQRMAGGNPDAWSLCALEPGSGYAAALAVEAPELTVRCWSLED
jgi:4'-phosphopantetheinyl transferase